MRLTLLILLLAAGAAALTMAAATAEGAGKSETAAALPPHRHPLLSSHHRLASHHASVHDLMERSMSDDPARVQKQTIHDERQATPLNQQPQPRRAPTLAEWIEAQPKHRYGHGIKKHHKKETKQHKKDHKRENKFKQHRASKKSDSKATAAAASSHAPALHRSFLESLSPFVSQRLTSLVEAIKSIQARLKEQVEKVEVTAGKSEKSEVKKTEEAPHHEPPHHEPPHIAAKKDEEAAKPQEKHMLGQFPRHPAHITLRQPEPQRVDVAITITDIIIIVVVVVVVLFCCGGFGYSRYRSSAL